MIENGFHIYQDGNRFWWLLASQGRIKCYSPYYTRYANCEDNIKDFVAFTMPGVEPMIFDDRGYLPPVKALPTNDFSLEDNSLSDDWIVDWSNRSRIRHEIIQHTQKMLPNGDWEDV